MNQTNSQQEAEYWNAIKGEIQSVLDRYQRELEEIGLMLEQSQVDVNKMANRNASIASHLQRVKAQFETMPRADIRMAYDSALDAQQRLFVLRGQVEKLQSDKDNISKYVELLERVQKAFEGETPSEAAERGASTAAATVEMMVQAQESERLHLSRQMHDGPAQSLSNFILQADIAMRLLNTNPDRAKDELENLKASAIFTLRKVRDFIFELRPMMLDDLGMIPTLKRYVDTYKEQTGMDIQLTVSGSERRLESYQEVMIFRAIQELLNNAARYSNASVVKVQIDMGSPSGSIIKVIVDDDGKGFSVEDLPKGSGKGLEVIKDRVEMLGGSMTIDSASGQGTHISFQTPTTSIGTDS